MIRATFVHDEAEQPQDGQVPKIKNFVKITVNSQTTGNHVVLQTQNMLMHILPKYLKTQISPSDCL